MKVTVIPNLHPSAVLRSRAKNEPIFKQAFESIQQFLDSSIQLKENASNFIVADTHSLQSILETLKKQNFKLIDVQRYKTFVGDDVVDQGIFAIFSNGNQHKYVLLDNVNFHFYYVKPDKQIPEPLLPETACYKQIGPTCKSIVVDRYKALPFDKDKVYYNYDLSIDDWLVFQIKSIIPDEPSYRIAFFDIEVFAEDGLFPNEKEAKYPISAMSFMVNDTLYQIINCEIIDEKFIDQSAINQHIQENGITFNNYKLIKVKSEKDLLDVFAKLLRENQIDVLTAWNIYFDINYIANRCKVIGYDTQQFSPVNKPMYPSGKLGYHFIPGIIVVDLLELYKSYEGRETSYSLDHIAGKVLGVSKVKYSGTLVDLVKREPNKFIAYSIVDTYLIKKLEDKRGNLALHLMLKDLSWISFLNSFSTLSQIDGLMFQYASKENLLLRQRPRNAEKSNAFVGAFVREPRKGLIQWAIDLDASSMYPSIMISLNISPETFIGFIEEALGDTYLMEKILLTNELDDKEVTLILDPKNQNFIDVRRVKIKVKDLKDHIYNSKLTIGFSGAIFSREKKGFIVNILEDLIKRRKAFKKKALKLLASSDPEEKALGAKYNIIQKALKVLANAIYGAMGNQAYRFFDTRISITITLTGQYEIKFVSGITENLIKALIDGSISDVNQFDISLNREVVRQAEGEQYYVFYSDTDSSFIDIYELLADEIPKVVREFEDLKQVRLGDEIINLPDNFDEKVRTLVNVKYKALKEKIDTDCPIHHIVANMFGDRGEDH